MFMLLLACCATAALDTWTVDDNGPADFNQISTAVASVAAGDVLLVEPGTYDGFVLQKRLSILGRAGGPRPHVTGTVRLDAPSDSPSPVSTWTSCAWRACRVADASTTAR